MRRGKRSTPHAAKHGGRHNTRPIVPIHEWTVDQLFLRRFGGRVVVHVSLVSHQNELSTRKLYPPTDNPETAMRFAAREIAWLKDTVRADRVRVRWAKTVAGTTQDQLERDEALEQIFRAAFDDTLEEVRARLR